MFDSHLYKKSRHLFFDLLYLQSDSIVVTFMVFVWQTKEHFSTEFILDRSNK